MNDMENKYLPLGTIVLLKNGTRKVMITGFAGIPRDKDQKIYDYSGCTYPEGFLSYDKILVFNHDQIREVVFKGYVNEEEINFKNTLNDQIATLQQNNV